jgi:hypothetical protein
MISISLNNIQTGLQFPELEKDAHLRTPIMQNSSVSWTRSDGVIVDKPFADPHSEFREYEIRQEWLKQWITSEIKEVMKNSKNPPSSQAFFIEISLKSNISSIRENYSHIWQEIYSNWWSFVRLNNYIDSLTVQNRDKVRKWFDKDFYLLLRIIHEFHTSITKNSPN